MRYQEPRDGDKAQARHRVTYLVKMGRLPRPATLPCTDCGHTGTDRRHEYDHHMGYGAAHHADVQAVCSKCHHAREAVRGVAKPPPLIRPESCKRGHPFTPENTRTRATGWRECRTCGRASDAIRRQKPEEKAYMKAYLHEYRKKRKTERDGDE